MEWQTTGLVDPRRQQQQQRFAESHYNNQAADQQQYNTSSAAVATASTAVAPHVEGLGIKRQNSKDPRMRADNVKKRKFHNATAIPTPFEIETRLYNGSKFVATITMEGKQTCYHESKIR